MVTAALDLVDRFKDDDIARAAVPALQTLGLTDPLHWCGGRYPLLGSLIRAKHHRGIARPWLTEITATGPALDTASLALAAIRLAAVAFFSDFTMSAHTPNPSDFKAPDTDDPFLGRQ